jgi:hypothetical protein
MGEYPVCEHNWTDWVQDGQRQMRQCRTCSSHVWWNVHTVRAGDAVLVLTAGRDWVPGTALSGVERGDKFPIVWVDTTGNSRTPWPLTDGNGIPAIAPADPA